MDNYTLYLDESETKTYDQTSGRYKNPHFCMAGIIIADSDMPLLTYDLNQFKHLIWKEFPDPELIILHQMQILEAEKNHLNTTKYPEYAKFNRKANRKIFYSELKKIFTKNNVTIIGCCISEDHLVSCYKFSNNIPDKYLIAMQLILENYSHFLCANNAQGKTIYESRELKGDERLRDRYYHLKLMGSMYMSRITTEKHLLGLDFLNKSENNTGLQLADFVPYSFARDFGGMSQPKYNIFNTLRFRRYDGGMKMPERYGVKYIP